MKVPPGYAQRSTECSARSTTHPRFSVFSPDPVDDALSDASPFWRAEAPVILASKSAGRRAVLAQAGLPFETRPADVDERGVQAALGPVGADAVAKALARAKALAVSTAAPGRLVIGSDQVASCETRIFGKPETMEKAAELLRFLSGRRHRLHSALALARDGAVIFETLAHADLTMRPLSEAFILSYLETMGETALTSAGAYQVEGLGAQLFSKVEGDHWTIMGLPVLPLLDALRRNGALLA